MRYFGKLTLVLLALVLAVGLSAASARPALAQGGDEFELPEGVTWDEVNGIAHKMYCDVCEGVPLDECESVACREWREEIALQLSAGRTEDQIVDYFVERYGADVAALPRTTMDRILAFAVPFIIALIIGGIGVQQVAQMRGRGHKAGQPVRRRAAARQNRPVPDDIDPVLLDRLISELEGLEA